MAPIGYTRTAPSGARASRIARVMPALSLTGLGVGHRAHGREAAARPRPACRSRSSPCPRGPGSRRWVWRSMKPGQTTSPATSIALARRAPRSRRPSCAIAPVLEEHVEVAVHAPRRDRRRGRPSSRSRAHDAASARRPAAGRGRAMRTATPFVTWSRITEYGPSATSLAISTPRFMGPGAGSARPSWRAARAPRSGRSARGTRAAMGSSPPSMRSQLDAQHHDRVGALDRLVDAWVTGASASMPGRHQGRAARTAITLGAHLGQQPQVRARHPAVQDVAHDRPRAGPRAGPSSGAA